METINCRGISTFYIFGMLFFILNASTPILLMDKSRFKNIKLIKKTWNKNIKLYKNLVFIWKYYEHLNKYKTNIKKKIWVIISNFLKQKTGYKLVYSIQTITW